MTTRDLLVMPTNPCDDPVIVPIHTSYPSLTHRACYISGLLLLPSRFSRVRLCVTPETGEPTRLRCPWDSPGKNTEVGCHFLPQCMKVKSESEVAQSCPTLSDPMDCTVHRILQARILECIAFLFSRGSSQPRDQTQVSHILY